MIMKQSIIRYSDYHRENLSSVRGFFVFCHCEDGLEGGCDNPLISNTTIQILTIRIFLFNKCYFFLSISCFELLFSLWIATGKALATT